VADIKRRKGERSKIKSDDEAKVASRFQNVEYYFRNGLTFSRTGIYAPTFRISSASCFDAKSDALFPKRYNLSVVLGLLNSTWVKYVIKTYLCHTVEAEGDAILGTPFALRDEEIIRKIEGLIETIIERQKSDARYPYYLHEQREIDALVYQLYGLDENDIREVELWYCRRYPKLAEAQGVMAEVREKYKAYLEWAENIQKKPPHYWSSHPILKLIAQGEGPQLEFKETLEADVTTGAAYQGVLQSALKTIDAFLNTDGGTLLIGVSDTLEIKGLDKDYRLIPRRPNADGFENKLRDLLGTRFDPVPLGKVQIHFDHLPDGTVCRIEVQKSNEVINFDNAVYLRDGNRTIKLEGRRLAEWIAQRTRGRA